MNQSNGKTRAESMSIMTELVLPNDTNIIGNLLGGRLLHWIDIAGALAASRHACGLVATLTMDTVEFRYPVKMGSIVTLKAYLTWSGRTSMETAVEVYVEEPCIEGAKCINRSYLVYVAVDKNGNKRNIVPYLPITEEEKMEFDGGVERRKKRMENNAADFAQKRL